MLQTRSVRRCRTRKRPYSIRTTTNPSSHTPPRSSVDAVHAHEHSAGCPMFQDYEVLGCKSPYAPGAGRVTFNRVRIFAAANSCTIPATYIWKRNCARAELQPRGFSISPGCALHRDVAQAAAPPPFALLARASPGPINATLYKQNSYRFPLEQF